MYIQNAKLYNQEGLWSIEVINGKFHKVTQQEDVQSGPCDLDLKGNLLLPPFVEPHIHLDCVLTAGQPRFNQSGTLFEGIQCWSERKLAISETKDDIKARAYEAIKMQIHQGIQHIRTHVDITDPSLTGLQALLEIREEMRDLLDIQIVAFPQEGIYAYPKGDELLEESLKMGADVVGGIPHYERTREDGVRSVQKSFELASRYNKLVDIHCDEIDDEQSRFLEVVASETYRLGMGELVTASHTTAMGSYNDAYTYKLFKVLKQANLNFVSLPKANIHLQGRFDSYPKRRGVTRVKELLEANLNVCFGLDSILDPWYPLGDGNLIRVVEFGLHVCHMTGYQDIMKALELITTNGAKTMQLKGYGIKEGNDANFVVLDTKSEYDAIRCNPTILYSVRKGNILSSAKPSEPSLHVELPTKITV